MSTTIPRLSDTYGTALDAANALKARGFRADEIDLISTASNQDSGPVTEISQAIGKAGIPAGDVEAFASAVNGGKSLLVVRAVWGAAVKAIGVVDSHNPTEEGVGRREYYASKSNDTSIFSSTFGLPMLLSDPAPFSKFWNLPMLSSDATPFSSMLTLPTLWKGFLFGIPKLLSDGALFSNELRIPVLLKSRSSQN